MSSFPLDYYYIAREKSIKNIYIWSIYLYIFRDSLICPIRDKTNLLSHKAVSQMLLLTLFKIVGRGGGGGGKNAPPNSLVLTLFPHWCEFSRPYLVSIPNYWTWTKTTLPKKWFFWLNPIKFRVKRTFLIGMQNLLISGERMLMSAGRKVCVTWFMHSLELL